MDCSFFPKTSCYACDHNVCGGTVPTLLSCLSCRLEMCCFVLGIGCASASLNSKRCDPQAPTKAVRKCYVMFDHALSLVLLVLLQSE